MKYKYINILFGILILITLTPSANASFRAKANDTVAGYSTAMSTSYGETESDVIFRIKKPNGGIIEISSTTNEVGVAKADLLGFHTKKTGTYSIVVYPEGENYENRDETYFKVFPDEISTTVSTISSNPSSLSADGNEQALIKVSLKDKYENPINNHNVMAISSRNEDIIEQVNQASSDDKGNIFFYISSKETGISHVSIIDKTSGEVLSGRAKLVFYEPDVSPRGGDYYSANIFGDTGNVVDDQVGNESSDTLFGNIDHFDIDFPNKIEVGSDQNFLTITAMDKNGKTVKNYMGTIIISTPEDENAQIPNSGKYTFQDKDQGERSFDLALIFSKTGKQTIEVYDFDTDTGTISEYIKGEHSVEIVESSPTTGGGSEYSNDIVIKKPTEESRNGNSNIMLIGKARPNTNLKIFIDDIKVGETEVDIDGLFTEEIDSVNDGNHIIYVRESEGAKEISQEVSFEIDTTPPPLDEISITPEGGVEEGEPFTITVLSDPDLEEVSFSGDGIKDELMESSTQKGKYELSLVAPEKSGEYPLSITLMDDLENTANFSNRATLLVLPKGGVKAEILGLSSNSTADEIIINWQGFSELPENVNYISVHYGRNKFNLSEEEKVDLNATKANLRNLESNAEYFFAIKLFGSGDNELWSSKIFSKETKEEVVHSTAYELLATAGDGKVFLKWTESGASAYTLGISIPDTNMSEDINIDGNNSSAIVKNLINGQEYMFRLTAQGTDKIYPTAYASPIWGGVHPLATEPILNEYDVPENSEQGPMSTKILFSSLLFVLAITFFRKSIALFR